MLNFKEIFKAWITFANPTEQEEKLAKARLNICEGCIYKKEIVNKQSWSLLCGKCGCPIQAKVFSDALNPCPMGYWKEIDKTFGTIVNEKNKKSIL